MPDAVQILGPKLSNLEMPDTDSEDPGSGGTGRELREAFYPAETEAVSGSPSGAGVCGIHPAPSQPDMRAQMQQQAAAGRTCNTAEATAAAPISRSGGSKTSDARLSRKRRSIRLRARRAAENRSTGWGKFLRRQETEAEASLQEETFL